MQPYFAPYAGYFRLLNNVDIFVIFDNCQFPRRGWIHRNKLLTREGSPEWLTLPLEYAPQEARIKDLRFAPDASERMQAYSRRFPALRRLPEDVRDAVFDVRGWFYYYTVKLLIRCARHLNVKVPKLMYASEIPLQRDLKGQDRILALCGELGATQYLNAPGGKALYQPEAFAAEGIELQFLSDWDGPMESCLQVIAA